MNPREARTLAERLVDGRGIPEEYPEDALHIAIAAVNGMDVIVTWNFVHMNNHLRVSKSERLSKPKDTCVPKSVLPKNSWS